MTFNLNTLKKNSSLDKLKQAVDKAASGGKYTDDRFWSLDVDKAGNGYAVIRFLDTPFVDGEDGLPWVQLWSHGFKGPGGWYIENSLTTLNMDDPVSEYNKILWHSGIEANKKIVSLQKRKLNYISNILVISDPKHPENEGKVKLFKYGKEIFEKISEKLTPNPEFPDEVPMQVFSFFEGANFKLKARTGSNNFRTYDKSEFEAPSKLFGGDEDKITAVWKSEHSLKEIIDPKNFKSYDELKARMNRVLGLNNPQVARVHAEADQPSVGKEAQAPKATDTPPWENGTVDPELDFYQKLAQENS